MDGVSGEPDAVGQRALLVALGRVAAGDRRALEDLYRRTSAKLLGICLRILSERADAEEALQDTYVSVWRHAAAFDATRARPMTWLIAIARNRALDRLRSRGSRPVEPIEAAERVADGGVDALAAIETREDEMRVRDCLAGLAPDESALIRTAFLEGVTYAALAERDGVPLGTVKSRIRRGLLKLRACLA